MVDLSKLSIGELRTLLDQVAKEIDIEQQRSIARARQEIEQIAGSVGMSIKQLMGTVKVRKSSGPVAAIFQSKDDPSLKWSGRGSQPRWVKQWISAGNRIDELRI